LKIEQVNPAGGLPLPLNLMLEERIEDENIREN